MTRVKTGITRHAHHKKILNLTKGFRMTKNRLIKVAREASLHAGQYAFAGRRDRKNQMRRLWIQRISAALKGIDGAPRYSIFIKTLKDNKIILDRKILATLALSNPSVFSQIVKKISK
jgi:large subunit ribosomal protein L20